MTLAEKRLKNQMFEKIEEWEYEEQSHRGQSGREYKNSRGNHIIRRSVPSMLFIRYSSFRRGNDAIGQLPEWGIKTIQARHRSRLRARILLPHRLPKVKTVSPTEGGGTLRGVAGSDRQNIEVDSADSWKNGVECHSLGS